MTRSGRCERRCVALIAASVLVALAAGCETTGTRSSEASQAATAFLRAWRDGDGTRACRLLAPRARQELRSAARAACPQAVVAVTPPEGTAASLVDVYGGQARVRVRGDTLFLARFEEGWKVTAAGCRARQDGTGYSCEIQGS